MHTRRIKVESYSPKGDIGMTVEKGQGTSAALGKTNANYIGDTVP